ncbi:CMGC family protein kinase [Histomonas meleagridis]|uniref:CMGC family protein kinase n=1 Tax=Histomonas meleagridis TaxID=135588 RepID=UPI00355A561A|nr:CMGC family protein kinase [Histomonas meleagridis]KAH0800983.1 CMGC family protein kinase [Histomonas meleagridis]
MKPKQSLSSKDFQILETLGTGTFSNVYHAVHISTGIHVALKRLFWNNSPDRIVNEVRWFLQIDHPNIVKALAIFREEDQATIVFEYVQHVQFRQLLSIMKCDMIKDYFRGLLSALNYAHQHSIIHRDVKPANYLFNPETRHGSLIDFGLSEENLHIEPQPISIDLTSDPIPNDDNDAELNYPEQFQRRPKMVANRAGTRGFRAPEVLMSAFNQSALIDIWSAGVILLSIITHRYPFFKSPDDLTALCEISVIFGTQKLHETARECGRKIKFPKEIEPLNLREMCYGLNAYINELELDESVFDLLEKMLEPRPSQRITAEQALNHPFLLE